MPNFCYEIYLRAANLSPDSWRTLLNSLRHYLGHFAAWKVIITLQGRTLHYYLMASHALPTSLGDGDFLLYPSSFETCSVSPRTPGIDLNLSFYSLGTLIERLHSSGQKFSHLQLHCRLVAGRLITCATLYYFIGSKLNSQRIICYTLYELIAIDFTKHPALCYKKFPTYLKSEKALRYASTPSPDALLLLYTFPYTSQRLAFRLTDFDFDRHSLILGGSGVGKSKFIALLVQRIATLQQAGNYKILIIDPHDALREDLSAISDQAIFDFQTPASSLNLFAAEVEHLGAYVELMLGLFQSLLGDNYNSRLERVLRHSISLLTVISDFSFVTLRRLLLEVSFRNQLLNDHRDEIPSSTAHFFLADFSELRTQAYDLAIAPIIAFIDEMQMTPVFNEADIAMNFADSIRENFLTIFSLSRTNLGEKITRTIAGLLMQQIFLLAESNIVPEHLIVIIDEVAAIESPILARFLSELRKYHVSVILAGQYLAQLSPNLLNSIFANTSNYYLFRVSKSDATLLARNLKIKLAHKDTIEHREEFLTGLRARECLVRLSRDGELLPTVHARTPDFEKS